MKEDFIPYNKNNEKGFILPYLFFISLLILTLLGGSISVLTHQKELILIKEEQIRLNTLFLLGYSDFIKSYTMNNLSSGNIYTYEYPDGSVQVQYQLTGSNLDIDFTLTTKNSSKKQLSLTKSSLTK